MIRLLLAFLAVAALSACSDSASQVSPTSPSPFDTAATGSVPSSQNGPPSTTASTAAPSPSAANYEQRFMMGMIDHHQMAVEMAEMCLAKAVHDELRQMCEGIIATQSQEIQQMQDWLRNWYGVSYSPQMSSRAEKDLAHLSSFSGAEFEIMFLEMMIRHHEGAIREGQTCVDRAYHRQLIRLCQNIISTQSAEIARMQEWLCEWYSRCTAS